MKRRQFLSWSAAGIGFAGAGKAETVNGQRLFGVPMYLRESSQATLMQDKLRLALGRIEMPVEAWEPLANLARLWGLVLSDAASRRAFRAGPRRFLRRHGVPDDIIHEQYQAIRLLELMADPYVRHLAGSGQYRLFIGKLREIDLLHDDAERSLRHRVRRILEKDRVALRRQIARAGIDVSNTAAFTDSAELYEITRELAAVNSITQSVAAAVVVVVVAALAATYVSVGVNVTVALNLGVTISVAVSTAVTTGGGGGGGVGGVGGCNYCHRDIGALAALEPKMRENLALTLRAARLSGQPAFATEAIREYIHTETRACLLVAEELDVIQLPAAAQARQTVIDAVGRLTCKAAGLL